MTLPSPRRRTSGRWRVAGIVGAAVRARLDLAVDDGVITRIEPAGETEPADVERRRRGWW